jgi:HEAT repeat protein
MHLFTALLTIVAVGVDPNPEQITKARGDLMSVKVEVRRAAIRDLIHSELSEHLVPEMRDRLKDADGEVRSTAATALGNLGTKGVPAVPALIEQLQTDKYKEARETSARALGRLGKAVPTNRIGVKPLQKAAAEDADPSRARSRSGRWR